MSLQRKFAIVAFSLARGKKWRQTHLGLSKPMMLLDHTDACTDGGIEHSQRLSTAGEPSLGWESRRSAGKRTNGATLTERSVGDCGILPGRIVGFPAVEDVIEHAVSDSGEAFSLRPANDDGGRRPLLGVVAGVLDGRCASHPLTEVVRSSCLPAAEGWSHVLGSGRMAGGQMDLPFSGGDAYSEWGGVGIGNPRSR